MTITAAAGLVDALRETGILEPTQLDEVIQTLQIRAADSGELSRELVDRGWPDRSIETTPSQARKSS